MTLVDLPPPLRGTFFERHWDTPMVWALPTASTSMPLEELTWQLDLPIWTTIPGEPRFDLAPAQVLARPERYRRRWAKIGRVDVCYPLEMFESGPRWLLLDGYHRLCRLYLARARHVAVRRHPASCWRQIEVMAPRTG